jgi:dTDP-D-glucose 4,6-dehydratase
MTLLVTRGVGFIDAHFVLHWLAEHQYRAMARENSDRPKREVL